MKPSNGYGYNLIALEQCALSDWEKIDSLPAHKYLQPIETKKFMNLKKPNKWNIFSMILEGLRTKRDGTWQFNIDNQETQQKTRDLWSPSRTSFYRKPRLKACWNERENYWMTAQDIDNIVCYR